MADKEMEEPCLELTQQWIKCLSDGTFGHEVDTLTTRGIQIVKAHKGFLLCHFIIHNGLLDENENWHVSAISILVDMLGGCASYTSKSAPQVTVGSSISYYSTAKVQEEVEIEAKVIGEKGDLTSVIVKVRKKQNGELVALAKLWTAAPGGNPIPQASKL